MTGSPFRELKKDYTPVKINNNRLQKIYDELRALENLKGSALNDQLQADALTYERALLKEAQSLREKIKKDKGMPIPLPNDLGKRKQRARMRLFK